MNIFWINDVVKVLQLEEEDITTTFDCNTVNLKVTQRS